MRSCVADRQTDGRTDGAGYIGPAEGNGGSKKYLKKKLDYDENFKKCFFYQSNDVG